LKEKLNNIFDFLINNRIYNKELQIRYYQKIINPQDSISKNVISLLYKIANTQSQPNINYLSSFYQKIYREYDLLNSFNGFMSIIKPNGSKNEDYIDLFNGMSEQPGWGKKTSALFVKTVYHLHNKEYPNELKLWRDIKGGLVDNDKLFLPVDSVIIAIFNKIEPLKWNFNNINQVLSIYYSGEEIEVWDDLWFWGFITQMGSGRKRQIKWNMNKYWVLEESDKSNKTINEINIKANEFLKIL